MASFEQGADPVRADNIERRPRVRLPPEPARVNLPSGPAHWARMPVNTCNVPSIPPNTVSYEEAFPGLGTSTPRINIPIYTPPLVQYPLRSDPDYLEDRIRGMILNNNFQQRSIDYRAGSTWDQHSSQYAAHPLNQLPRRQQYSYPNGNNQANRPFPGQNPFSYAQSQSQYPVQVPTTAPNPRDPSNRGNLAPNQTHGRLYRQPRQLYDPSGTGLRAQQQNPNQLRKTFASLEAQIGYLDLAAHIEVPRVQMDVKEYDEKDSLRLVLEQVCRKAVFERERTKRGPHFKAESVELKCFGSMSSTFATKSSDMDLVLVSPSSKPDVGAPESAIPRLVEKALLDSGYGVRLLTKTRVPIIRFCEKPTSELRELLLKERAKFEDERDAPPSTPKKSGKCSKKEKPEKPDPTLPQNRPNSVPEQLGELKESESINPLNNEHLVVKDKVNADEPLKPPQMDGVQVAKHADGNDTKPQSSMEIERSDPNLSGKSDEERVRLYQLAIQEGWYEQSERQIITNYIQLVGRKTASEVEKSKARELLGNLPNVIGRYRPPPEIHPLEFPKSGVGVQCDINFSNHLALHNSHLLKCYSLCDTRVRQMVLFVKSWSKKRKINTPYHGTLSSYGYVLMVLHYLVNIVYPPVLFNLQRTPLAFEDKLSSQIVELDGHNVQFLRNEAVIESLLKDREVTRNSETLGSLLHGFFYYYAHQGYNSPSNGFSWLTDVLSLRTNGGLLSKQSKGWTGAKTETVELKGPGPQQTKEIRQRYLFAIEDPFEIEHNIARTVVHNGIVTIRDEFRRAHKLIENAGMVPGKGREDLLVEAEDRENLQYRAFGPKPRSGPDRKKNGGPKGVTGATPTAAAAAPT